MNNRIGPRYLKDDVFIKRNFFIHSLVYLCMDTLVMPAVIPFNSS